MPLAEPVEATFCDYLIGDHPFREYPHRRVPLREHLFGEYRSYARRAANTAL